MSVNIHINQNGKVKEIIVKSIQLNTDNTSFVCTAFEYGNLLAKALEKYIKTYAHAEADVEVRTEDDIPLHRLKIVYLNGECSVTDRIAGTYKPSIPFRKRSEKLPDKYLILVDAEKNKNEFYKMTDSGGGEWSATNGRIGEKQGRSRMTRNVVVPKSYPDYMFGIKLMEKTLMGYQDKSTCHGLTILRKNVPNMPVSGIKNSQVADLIGKFMAYAQNVICQNYTVSYTDVTPEMIRQANVEITYMRKRTSLDEFNRHFLSLMHIIPRRIDGRGVAGVKRMLAKNESEYADILVRETELLDIMEGQSIINQDSNKDENILDKMGLVIDEATAEEIENVKKYLTHSLQSKLKQVFSVTNMYTQGQFDAYLKHASSQEKKKETTRLFWHGSRNANWFSILQKGLMLNPDAVITGKMFGNGIYFAPSAAKSWGYTSSKEAKWNNETSSAAYMALYETAYGTPYVVDSYDENWKGYSYKRLQAEHPGCACVHAKKDRGMLFDDEIIFYREDQVTIQYICTFKAE